jgi:hypothetical protein
MPYRLSYQGWQVTADSAAEVEQLVRLLLGLPLESRTIQGPDEKDEETAKAARPEAGSPYN